jgi:hypothetical protein
LIDSASLVFALIVFSLFLPFSLSVADLYLVTVLGWSGYLGVDLSPYSNIGSYIANVNSQGEVVSARQKLAEASKKA